MVGFLDFSLNGGLIKGDKLIAFFRDHFVDRDIADLKRPFGAVATDLRRGREVWLREGRVSEAVRASIMLGAVVIAFGIGLINSNTSGKHGEMVTHPQMSAAVPASAMQNTHTTKVSLVPVSLLTVTRTEDREADAKAARDLQTAERIARENEAARRAQETAVQQQAYVQTLLSRQAQMPQISVGSPSLQRSGRVSAVSAAVSSTVR